MLHQSRDTCNLSEWLWSHEHISARFCLTYELMMQGCFTSNYDIWLDPLRAFSFYYNRRATQYFAAWTSEQDNVIRQAWG